jgi:hypothetical protein
LSQPAASTAGAPHRSDDPLQAAAQFQQKSPPRQGGWQMNVDGYYGVDFAGLSSRFIRANGNQFLNGWRTNP